MILVVSDQLVVLSITNTIISLFAGCGIGSRLIERHDTSSAIEMHLILDLRWLFPKVFKVAAFSFKADSDTDLPFIEW